MRDCKLFKLIDNTKEETKAFHPTKQKHSSPMVKNMAKFVHFNLTEEKSIFKGLSKFKPTDLR